jgi:dienelactone hydrolase
MRIVLILIFTCLFSSAWAGKKYSVSRNISYVDPASAEYDKKGHKLDVYAPVETGNKKNKVLIFIHGGAWRGGSKDSHNHRKIGKAFAANGIVTVVITYRLSPDTKYYGMAADCAKAFAWVSKNIEQYGGDKNQIYVSGHSAGGHLAALITTDSSYLKNEGFEQQAIRGCILNDPYGLDMLEYLGKGTPVDVLMFTSIFTELPTEWKKGSPYYHIEKDNVKYYILYGGTTMPMVKEQAIAFYERNRYLNNRIELDVVPLRSHFPMVEIFGKKKGEYLQKVVRFIEDEN